MEESMQQYSHKYEVLHSGQKPFKNEKKTKFLPQRFQKLKLAIKQCYQTCQLLSDIQMRHLEVFLNNVPSVEIF